jgi:hypothetical protein
MRGALLANPEGVRQCCTSLRVAAAANCAPGRPHGVHTTLAIERQTLPRQGTFDPVRDAQNWLVSMTLRMLARVRGSSWGQQPHAAQ